jgi:hypothetical protein
MRIRELVLVSAIAALMAAPAEATPFTWILSGTISSVDPSLAGTFGVGQSATMAVTIAPDAPSYVIGPNARGYGGGAVSVTVTFGSYAATATSSDVLIWNDDPTVADMWSVAFLNPSGPSVGGSDLGAIVASLHDGSATALDDLDVPTLPLDPADFDDRLMRLDFGSSFSEEVVASLDTISVIPEPSTAMLLGGALATLSGVSRRRRARSDR